MRAVKFHQFSGLITVEDVEVPYPAPTAVLIKVEATGLCRSDWHGYVGHDSDIKLPHIPGHEFAGVIAQVGNQVKNFKVGERVTVPFVNGCGKCIWCSSGNAQVCPDQTQPGFTQNGSFAEYVEIRNADFNLVALPKEISFEVAAALGCRFATAYRGLTARGHVLIGESVAIFGCGGVGLSAVMIAKALGATVIAVDINTIALENAKELGADYLIHSSEIDPVSEIHKLTNGGAHVAIDALGNPITAQQSVLSLRRLGRHVQLGLLLSENGLTAMPMARVIGWELELYGSHGMAAKDYAELLRVILSGKLDPEVLIKKRITLDEVPDALRNMDQNIQDGITIIKP